MTDPVRNLIALLPEPGAGGARILTTFLFYWVLGVGFLSFVTQHPITNIHLVGFLCNLDTVSSFDFLA